MKNSIILLLFIIAFTSCSIQKPVVKNHTQLHNQAFTVTPAWEGETRQSVYFLSIAGGAASAAYGYYNPPLVINDNELERGVNTLVYGVAGTVVSRLLTKAIFNRPVSRKYKKEQAQKWVFDLNKSNNSNFVILEEVSANQDLIIVPQSKIQSYSKQELNSSSDKTLASATTANCTSCTNCTNCDGSYLDKNIVYQTASVYCYTEVAKKYTIHQSCICSNSSAVITSTDGESYKAGSKEETLKILNERSKKFCSDAIVIFD